MAVIVQNYLDIGGFSVEQLEDLIYQAKEQSNPVLDYLTINPIEQVFILIYQQNEDRILRIFE